MLKWDIYEISSEGSELTGVKLRGKLRKFGLENGINILAENTEDANKRVRIALLEGHDISEILAYLKTIVPDSKLELKLKGVHNPVLSKLKINHEGYA